MSKVKQGDQHIMSMAKRAEGSDCPPQVELSLFTQKALPPERSAALEAHVDRCLRCSNALKDLRLLTEAHPIRPSRAAERRLMAIVLSRGADLAVSPRDSWVQAISNWLKPLPQAQPALRGSRRKHRYDFLLGRGNRAARLSVTCSKTSALLELIASRMPGPGIANAKLQRDGKLSKHLVSRQGRIMFILDRPGSYDLSWGRSSKINIQMV